MKVCVFGDKGSFHTNSILDIFSKNHDVMLCVDDIGIAREIIAENPNINVSYNPVDIETQDVFIICNETDFNNMSQKIDITRITNVVELIKRYARKGATVVLESIVGVGTTRKLFGTSGFRVSYSPGRFDNTLIGTKSTDIPKLIGGIDEESERLAMQLYSTVFNTIIRTGSSEVAEGAALLEKSSNIVQKAFLNEFADFCDRINLDVHHVIDAAGTCMDKKLLPSPWVGNSTNDMSARHLIYHEDDWPVLYSATQQLERRPMKIYDRIVNIYCGKENYDELRKKCFLIVGLGEKIGSTTTRNSPILEIINSLMLEGAKIVKYDMFIDEYSKIPVMKHNSGLPRFDGILVMHPYNIPLWEKYPYTTFFCRH